MTDPRALIMTPLGESGSGRIRYGAAMELHRRGLLSDAQLEVYRVSSPHDDRDPALLLKARGLPSPPAFTPDGQAALAALLAEADRYLATLPGPGIAESRLGLERWRVAASPLPGPSNSVIETHLPAALATLHDTHPALAAAIRTAVPWLHWITYDGYDPEAIGAAFAKGHAFAQIVGQDAPVPAEDFDFGLFLIAPHILYRDHRHLAPELYAPLTGPHGWRFAPDAALTLKPAHDPVWNPPNQPHLTKVGPTPFLCFYAWTRDANASASVIPARDWDALERLHL